MLIPLLLAGTSIVADDLVWQDNPRAWHQQLARIVDVRFNSFGKFASFARQSKTAGVSALMLEPASAGAHDARPHPRSASGGAGERHDLPDEVQGNLKSTFDG